MKTVSERMQFGGWSVEKLDWDGIVLKGDVYNQHKVYVCSDEMHQLCKKCKYCVLGRPAGTFWRRKALGLEGAGPWTEALEKKLERGLAKILKRCRPVYVQVSEAEEKREPVCDDCRPLSEACLSCPRPQKKPKHTLGTHVRVPRED